MKTAFHLVMVVTWTVALLVQTGSVRGAEARKDWPCWRGPNGNGSAPDPGFKLVDDMSRAKLLWTSDQEIASDCKGRWAGGFSSPAPPWLLAPPGPAAKARAVCIRYP